MYCQEIVRGMWASMDELSLVARICNLTIKVVIGDRAYMLGRGWPTKKIACRKCVVYRLLVRAAIGHIAA